MRSVTDMTYRRMMTPLTIETVKQSMARAMARRKISKRLIMSDRFMYIVFATAKKLKCYRVLRVLC